MRPNKRKATARQWAAVFIVVLALMTPAPLAKADQGSSAEDPGLLDLPDVAEPQIDDPISEAELEDLKALASQKGMSLQAAIDRYAWTDNFALAVKTVREEYPESFSGAEIVGGRGAWVAFAANAPEGATDIIVAFEKAHATVAVEVRPNFGFTELEIEKAIETVHYAVFEAAGVRDATTSFDYETRQITTVVALKSGVPDAALDELRAGAINGLVDSGLGKLLDGVSITVLRSNVPTLGGRTTDSAHIGGEDLSGCTSGFTVKNGSGVRGVATAGHCGDFQNDDGVALTYKAGHEGAHGDFQWHTGPQGEPDDFYAGNATTWEVDLRDVAGVGAPVVNQSLCKNGYAGFRDCGYVIQLNVCHFGLCNLVQMDARTTVGGDSGGPFYWNYTAYGFMYGWRYDPVWPYDRDLFSRADRIDDALGVTVNTN
jgi:streptogrisin C